MKAFLYIILLLASLVFFNSCQKEFILPEKDEAQDSTLVTRQNPDSAVLNFIWIKTNDTYVGTRLEIKNDTGGVILNALDMLQSTDTVFQFPINCGIHLKKHVFTVKSPTGAVLDTMHFQLNYQEHLDELIISRENLTYFIQLSWLYKNEQNH
ncbi:MAG: hypothetical protein ACK4WD_02330 [Flavobacteriales bacterium]|jgi:energy-converting hydrogenase Eha subunit F